MARVFLCLMKRASEPGHCQEGRDAAVAVNGPALGLFEETGHGPTSDMIVLGKRWDSGYLTNSEYLA